LKQKVSLTFERDIPLLMFLWRWKVLTTAALAKCFFPEATQATAYKRLRNLERASYIQIRVDSSGRRALWTLTKKGFVVIRDQLPQLKEEGFLPEHSYHDLLVTAAHLGDWLCGVPPNVEVFTEQQLRRFHRDSYPAWVPKKELHRPDGYWRIKIGNEAHTIALEVELKQKFLPEYRNTSLFYSHFAHVHRVLWVVPSMSFSKTLLRQMGFKDKPNESFHNFVGLSDFQKNGWGAKIFLGNERDQTISSLLKTRPPEGPDISLGSLILDFRKSYQTSKTCPNSIST
jgi:hypothetical protein